MIWNIHFFLDVHLFIEGKLSAVSVPALSRYPSKFSYMDPFVQFTLISIHWVSCRCQAWCWVLKILRWRSPWTLGWWEREEGQGLTEKPVPVSTSRNLGGAWTASTAGKSCVPDAVGFQEWLGAKGVHKHSKLQEQLVQTRPGAQRVHTLFKAPPLCVRCRKGTRGKSMAWSGRGSWALSTDNWKLFQSRCRKAPGCKAWGLGNENLGQRLLSPGNRWWGYELQLWQGLWPGGLMEGIVTNLRTLCTPAL